MQQWLSLVTAGVCIQASQNNQSDSLRYPIRCGWLGVGTEDGYKICPQISVNFNQSESNVMDNSKLSKIPLNLNDHSDCIHYNCLL